MPEHEIGFDEEGNVKFKKVENVKRGIRSKQKGLQFELKIRKDLEGKGWVVAKWSNNVDLENKKIIAAKQSWKFNPFRKIMMPSAQGTGFPDFVAFQQMNDYYKIIGVEVKSNGKLSKEEKDKCKFYLDNKIFNEIWIARKDGKLLDYLRFELK